MVCSSVSRQREKKRQWRNLTAGRESREGALCRPVPSLPLSLRLQFASALQDDTLDKSLLFFVESFISLLSLLCPAPYILSHNLSSLVPSFTFFLITPSLCRLPLLPPSSLFFSLFPAFHLLSWQRVKNPLLFLLSRRIQGKCVRGCDSASRHLFCRLFVACVFHIPIVSVISFLSIKFVRLLLDIYQITTFVISH